MNNYEYEIDIDVIEGCTNNFEDMVISRLTDIGNHGEILKIGELKEFKIKNDEYYQLPVVFKRLMWPDPESVKRVRTRYMEDLENIRDQESFLLSLVRIGSAEGDEKVANRAKELGYKVEKSIDGKYWAINFPD